MFNSVLTKITDLFDKRLLTTVFFPSFVFWIALIAVVLVGASRLATAVETWNGQDVIVQLLQLVGFLAFVALFALLIASQLRGLLRLYEGYAPLPRFLRTRGKDWHKTELNKLKTDIDHKSQELSELETDIDAGLQSNYERDVGELYAEIYSYYPWSEDEVMPTLLGNVLKAGELYVKQRYKADAVLVWPRLYNLLPDASKTKVTDLRSSMETMLVVSFLGAVFAVSSAVLLVVLNADLLLFLVCLFGGFLVSWLAYWGAVSVAVPYAEQIRSTFDLHRKLVLKEMSVRVPQTVSAEREQWEKLDLFLYRNAPPCWDVAEGAAEEPEEEPS